MARMLRLHGLEHYTKQMDTHYSVEVKWESFSEWSVRFFCDGVDVYPSGTYNEPTYVYSRANLKPTIKAGILVLKALVTWMNATRVPSLGTNYMHGGDPLFRMK